MAKLLDGPSRAIMTENNAIAHPSSTVRELDPGTAEEETSLFEAANRETLP